MVMLLPKVSALWVKSEYPEWNDLIEIAENWRYGMEMKQTEKVVKFIEFTIDKVKDKIF